MIDSNDVLIPAWDQRTKQAQRTRVLSFLLGHMSSANFRFLGLPAEQWKFEKLVLDSNVANCHFVGVERRAEILGSGLAYMPRSPGTQVRPIKIARRCCQPLVGFRTDKAIWFRSELSSLVDVNPTSFDTPDEWIQFRELVYNRTAIWLDTCNSISNSLRHICTNLHKLLDPDVVDVPVVVTWLAAREKKYGWSPDVNDRLRTATVIYWLQSNYGRRFIFHSQWRYVSERRTPMLSVAGVFRRKKIHVSSS